MLQAQKNQLQSDLAVEVLRVREREVGRTASKHPCQASTQKSARAAQ